MKADHHLIVTIIMLYLAVPLQGIPVTYEVQWSDNGKVFDEVVEIDVAKKTAIFHVPSYEESEEADVIYDFREKLTMMSLPGKEVCYLSKLNDTIPRPRKMMKIFKKVPVVGKDFDIPKVKANLETKEVVKDRSSLTEVMRKACEKFPVYWTEPVAESVSVTQRDPISKRGKRQVRRRRGTCGSACVKVPYCYFTCPDTDCFECIEQQVCKPINC